MIRHESRSRLTLSELIEELDTVKRYNENFSSLSKAEKRIIWQEYMASNYPSIKSCFNCGSDATNGLCFYKPTQMISWHNSGSLAYIECEKCRLEFRGEYGIGLSVIEQWNSIGESI